MLTGTKAPRARRPAALAAVALTSITALMLTACATSSHADPSIQGTDYSNTGSSNTGSSSTGAPTTGTAVAGHASPSDPAPTGSPVPNRATVVTVSLHPDFNVHVTPPKPVAVTSPAAVRGLTSLIDGLPAFPSGTFSCPMDAGARLTLSFSAGQNGPVLMVATVGLEGCQPVGVTVNGKEQPARGGPDGGRAVAAQALKIGGLAWNLGHYL
jgi:hypothetical protein